MSVTRRTAVPRDEVIAAFLGLLSDIGNPKEDADQFVDDSLYDPYDRAHRRGEFEIETGE
ncbi:hypothetical protein [Nocardia sp. NPDC050710]|uniref:hypothetical protein n=1 Tax=Nocardia sp. NPDC050710 TaxID=3157220 RepID=UPI0033D3BC48